MKQNRKQRRLELLEAMKPQKELTPVQMGWLDKHAPEWRERGTDIFVTLFDDDPDHEYNLEMAESIGVSVWVFTMNPDKVNRDTIISVTERHRKS
jgi:hypothetical protein